MPFQFGAGTGQAAAGAELQQASHLVPLQMPHHRQQQQRQLLQRAAEQASRLVPLQMPRQMAQASLVKLKQRLQKARLRDLM